MSDRDQQHAKIRAEVDAFLEAEKDQWDMDAAGGVGALEWNAYKLGATDFAFSEWNRNRAPVEPPVLSRADLKKIANAVLEDAEVTNRRGQQTLQRIREFEERFIDAILESLSQEEK